ncbi:TOBE domain-containing protein [Actinokineospora diospyrosa]|uniref:TOBE domain-containing protein n=1 Tax=Actinokineospora diospyrosa TaxID=103728 RepID=UPI003CD05BA7
MGDGDVLGVSVHQGKLQRVAVGTVLDDVHRGHCVEAEVGAAHVGDLDVLERQFRGDRADARVRHQEHPDLVARVPPGTVPAPGSAVVLRWRAQEGVGDDVAPGQAVVAQGVVQHQCPVAVQPGLHLLLPRPGLVQSPLPGLVRVSAPVELIEVLRCLVEVPAPLAGDPVQPLGGVPPGHHQHQHREYGANRHRPEAHDDHHDRRQGEGHNRGRAQDLEHPPGAQRFAVAPQNTVVPALAHVGDQYPDQPPHPVWGDLAVLVKLHDLVVQGGPQARGFLEPLLPQFLLLGRWCVLVHVVGERAVDFPCEVRVKHPALDGHREVRPLFGRQPLALVPPDPPGTRGHRTRHQHAEVRHHRPEVPIVECRPTELGEARGDQDRPRPGLDTVDRGRGLDPGWSGLGLGGDRVEIGPHPALPVVGVAVSFGRSAGVGPELVLVRARDHQLQVVHDLGVEIGRQGAEGVHRAGAVMAVGFGAVVEESEDHFKAAHPVVDTEAGGGQADAVELVLLGDGQVAQRPLAEHRQRPVEPDFSAVEPARDGLADQVPRLQRHTRLEVLHADLVLALGVRVRRHDVDGRVVQDGRVVDLARLDAD